MKSILPKETVSFETPAHGNRVYRSPNVGDRPSVRYKTVCSFVVHDPEEVYAIKKSYADALDWIKTKLNQDLGFRFGNSTLEKVGTLEELRRIFGKNSYGFKISRVSEVTETEK